jgi:mannonate dehydratase
MRYREPVDLSRRAFVLGGAATLLASPAAAAPLFDDRLLNPCYAAALPERLAGHEIVRAAWDGVSAERVWDIHVHLVGTGDSAQGPWLSPRAWSLLHPVTLARRLLLTNAACADRRAVDESFVARLQQLAEAFPAGVKLMLLAFDHHHDGAGRSLPEESPFHVPDRYAAAVAARLPRRFEWIASIHPFRADAVEVLEATRRAGARGVKWLPNAMGIDPASPRCDHFYEALARTDTPLLTHAGEEAAVDDAAAQELGNPLRLRRALDHGVRVIVAHCATLGKGTDLDKGVHGPRLSNFALFARLMDDPRYGAHLFADISAVVQRNRAVEAFPALLIRREWHPRLLWGSDYPLPGVLPLISVAGFAERGLLPPAEVPVLNEIRQHNPLLFDFVLKRRLVAGSARFASRVFETRRMFEPRTEGASPGSPRFAVA